MVTTNSDIIKELKVNFEFIQEDKRIIALILFGSYAEDTQTP